MFILHFCVFLVFSQNAGSHYFHDAFQVFESGFPGGKKIPGYRIRLKFEPKILWIQVIVRHIFHGNWTQATLSRGLDQPTFTLILLRVELDWYSTCKPLTITLLLPLPPLTLITLTLTIIFLYMYPPPTQMLTMTHFFVMPYVLGTHYLTLVCHYYP